MVTYTVYMKELSATSTWQDVTHAVVQSKDIPIRKGFGSLSDAIDVGSLTLTIHMESLQDAALLHVSQKQVLVQANGVTIFEGVSYDDADVDVEERSDYVFTKLKFKPYSALFEQAKVPTDTVWMDKKICDPSDTDNSLVHLLFDMIIDNLPGQLPDILSALFNISTAITNTKTLALVMLEAGESVEDYLTELLYQNGYAYWMELYTAIVVEPYATGRTPSINIPITSVVANPDISQAPYIDEKKCVVRLGKIEEYADEVVYELNGDRYEDSGEPTQVALLEPGDYYPTDSDEAPSELEADYETERENDDIELVYAEGLSYDYMARQNDPSDASKTIPAYIVFGTHELNPTQATFQLYNNLAVNVSLRNIRVLAQTAYYRNWAEKYFDESTTATEEDETDGIWMPDAATARAFVSRYRAELKAQATHVSFQTHVSLQPNTLFTITGLPYQLLVRYVTKLEEGFYEYDCVAYSVDTVSVGTRIRVIPKKTTMDGFSPVPVHLYALGDETSPFDTSTVVSDGTSVVSDGINRLGVSSDWTLERPTPTTGQYVWQIIGYYTPPATWPTVWSEPVRLTGDTGEDAKGIALLASSVTIPTTSRGVPRISTITFTAQLQNLAIPAGGLVWTTSQPGLTLTAIDEYSMSINTEDVTVDQLTVQVSDGTYIAYVAIVKVADGQPAPYNFGGVTTVPTPESFGEPLVAGDYFLWATTTTEDYTKGKIYEWNGTVWVESTNGDLVMTMFDSFADLANDVDSTVIGNAVIKKLVAIDAVVKNLVAQNMKAGLGTGLASSGFRFRAQTDSVGDGSNVAVFDVYKDDNQLFKVDISTGIIYFGEHFWYDPSDGAIHTPDDKTVIKADGTIEAVDGVFSGEVQATGGSFDGSLSADRILINQNAFKVGNFGLYTYNFNASSSSSNTKEIKMNAICSGSARCRASISRVSASSTDYADFRFTVIKNGTAVYTENLVHTSITATPYTFSYDISYTYNDIIIVRMGPYLAAGAPWVYAINGLGLFYDREFNSDDLLYYLQTEKVEMPT